MSSTASRNSRLPLSVRVCSHFAGATQHDALLLRCSCARRHRTRRRGVDLLTAQEDGTAELQDTDLLARSTSLGRVLFTQDIRFKARAEDWQREGRHFAGLLFGHQLHGSIGQYVRDLELIAKATEPEEWIGRVEKLPLT